MTTTRLPGIVREQGKPEPPTFLELFFDLVFIFTFRRLADALAANFTPVGVLRSAVLLLAVWWIWELIVWLTDLYDPANPQIQLMVLLAMFGSLVMGLVVPTAFAGNGWIFSVAYLGIVLTRSSILIIGTRGYPVQERSLRVGFWFALTAGPWLAGGFVPDPTARLGLWSLAVGVDYLVAGIGWPTPGLGRTNRLSRIFTGAHVSERHRQIFIIGLGEVILASGLKFTASGLSLDQWSALVAAFLTAMLLFLVYARQSRRLLAPPALWSMDRVGPGIITAYSHLIMVAGAVALSASDEFVARRPFADLHLAEVFGVVAGPTFFLFGSGLFEQAVTGRILWSRPAAIGLLLALAPLVGLLPGLVPAAGVVVVLAGTLVSDVTSPALRAPARAKYPA